MRLAFTSSRQADSLNTSAFASQMRPSEPLVREPSFEELFVEYQPLVYGIGLKFTGHPEDAEESLRKSGGNSGASTTIPPSRPGFTGSP